MRQWLSLMLAPFVFTACSDPATLVTAPHITALYGKPAETSLSPYPSDRYTLPDATTATGRRVHIGPDVTSDELIAPFWNITNDQRDIMYLCKTSFTF